MLTTLRAKIFLVLKRYAIENYLLDPLLVVGAMLNLSVRPSFLTIQFERMEAAEIRTIKTVEKQKIVNEFTAFIELNRPELTENHTGKFEVKYLDGTVLELPTWLREVRGHDLMLIYKAAIHTKFLKENIFSGTYEKLMKMLTDVLPGFSIRGRLSIGQAPTSAATLDPAPRRSNSSICATIGFQPKQV